MITRFSLQQQHRHQRNRACPQTSRRNFEPMTPARSSTRARRTSHCTLHVRRRLPSDDSFAKTDSGLHGGANKDVVAEARPGERVVAYVCK